MTGAAPAGARIDFARHVPALAGALALLAAAASRGLPWAGPERTWLLAGFGALHALTLAAALRGPPRPAARLAFIAVAALSSASAPLAGMSVAVSLGTVTPRVVLGSASAYGALLYLADLALIARVRLAARAALAIPAACAAVSLVEWSWLAPNGIVAPAAPGALIAGWWVTFSAGLWFAASRSD